MHHPLYMIWLFMFADNAVLKYGRSGIASPLRMYWEDGVETVAIDQRKNRSEYHPVSGRMTCCKLTA